MTQQTTVDLQIARTPRAGTFGGVRRQLVAAACGVALAVATVAGVAAWRVARHDAKGSEARSSSGLAAVHTQPTFTYLLVSSQDEAAQVDAALASSGYFPGAELAEHEIVVISSPAQEEQLLAAVADSGRFAASYGEEGPQIADLRPPAAGSTTASPAIQPAQELAPETGSTPLVHEQYPLVPQPAEGLAPSTVSMPHAAGTTFYLVASQQQADMVQAEVNPGGSIVAIAGSPEDLTRIQGAAALVENAQIVDLRPTVPSTYLLVSSPEEAQFVQSALDSGESRFGGHIAVRVAGSPDEEAELRRSIGSTGTIIDLRPLEGITSDDGS